MQRSNDLYPIERILSALSYFTAGLAGFVWMIIAALLKKRVTPFLMYHIMQSIFISILYFLIGILFKLVFSIVIIIPVINKIFYNFVGLFSSSIPMLYNMSIIQIITTTILVYLIISSFMGFYSYLPWISDIIDQNLGRK